MDGKWIKGIVHLHSKYSDGNHSISELAKRACKLGYSFMIVTDHAEESIFKKTDKVMEYVNKCKNEEIHDKFISIPGLEIASKWVIKNEDCSEAHTLVIDITEDWFEKILAIGKSTSEQVEFINNNKLIGLPAHQFQYSPLKASPAKFLDGSDFRYDMSMMEKMPHVDFYYRSMLEMDHETEDIVLYSYLVSNWIEMKRKKIDVPAPWVYSSSDLHVALKGWLSSVANLKQIKFFTSLFSNNIGLPNEQLSHSTWVYIENPLKRENIMDAFQCGRTCASRGVDSGVENISITPVPDSNKINKGIPEIKINISLTEGSKRPLLLYVLRDGVEITRLRYSYIKETKEIKETITDNNAPDGLHAYSVVVSGKFVSSPVLFYR